MNVLAGLAGGLQGFGQGMAQAGEFNLKQQAEKEKLEAQQLFQERLLAKKTSSEMALSKAKGEIDYDELDADGNPVNVRGGALTQAKIDSERALASQRLRDDKKEGKLSDRLELAEVYASEAAAKVDELTRRKNELEGMTWNNAAEKKELAQINSQIASLTPLTQRSYYLQDQQGSGGAATTDRDALLERLQSLRKSGGPAAQAPAPGGAAPGPAPAPMPPSGPSPLAQAAVPQAAVPSGRGAVAAGRPGYQMSNEELLRQMQQSINQPRAAGIVGGR